MLELKQVFEYGCNPPERNGSFRLGIQSPQMTTGVQHLDTRGSNIVHEYPNNNLWIKEAKQQSDNTLLLLLAAACEERTTQELSSLQVIEGMRSQQFFNC